MSYGKAIVLFVSFYFTYTQLGLRIYDGVFILHFLVLLIRYLPSFGLENIYKDLSRVLPFRPGADSGLEIGCFMVPLVLLSQLSFGKKNSFILEDNWALYHNAAIQMGLCTLLLVLACKDRKSTFTTLSVVLLTCYGIGVTSNFYWKGDTHEIFLVRCLLLYFAICLVIMKLLPCSFTLGEMMVLSQTLVILFVDYSISIYCRLRFLFPFLYSSSPTIVDDLPFTRTEITFILQTVVVGTLLTGLLLVPVFYYLNFVSDSVEVWIGFLSFYAVFLLSFIAIFLPSFYITLAGTNPVVWMYTFFYRRPTRVYLTIFWLFIVLTALATVAWRTHTKVRLPNIITRKIFHFLAVIIFLSGILYDPSLLHLSSSLAASLFLLLEFIRYGRIEPFGSILHKYLSPFVDGRDSGPLIFTHLYLLIGCALPLWLYPLDYHKLSGHGILLYSGVLSIGLGDSAASVIGVKFGRHHWRGTKKTLEGTAGSILVQLLALLPLVMWGVQFNISSVVFVIVLSSLLEAFTTQIDNFVLPPFTYALLAMTA